MPQLKKLDIECPVQFQYGFNSDCVSYEMTVTFNPSLWNHASCWKEGIPEFKSKILHWLESLPVTGLWISIEYTKKFFPHLHCCIQASEKINTEIRTGIVKGIQRLFGRCTFTEIINVDAYEEYMQKDLERNYDKTGICHFEIYMRN